RVGGVRDGGMDQRVLRVDVFERPASRDVAGVLGSPAMSFVDAKVVAAGDGLALRLGDGATLALPARRSANLGNWVEQPVVLGVRPEHLGRANPGERAGLARHSAIVELLQPTGSRTYATFSLG